MNSTSFMALISEGRSLDPYFSKIDNSITGENFYLPATAQCNNIRDRALLMYDIPGYLFPVLSHCRDSEVKTIALDRYPGFLMNLEGFANSADYISSRFGKTTRSRYRKYQKRLESCFNISYKIYYGSIKREKYDLLFDTLRNMLERRFDQKGVVNMELERIDIYREAVYPKILSKEAFIFVIYDGKKPIDIAFNYIFGKVVYSYMSGFNIDYSKFNLGSIDMQMHIDWCLQHGFTQIDLLKGDMEYKRRWCNHVYAFQYIFAYKSGSFPGALEARWLSIIKGHFPQFLLGLKRWNLHRINEKIRRLKFRKYQPTGAGSPAYQVVPIRNSDTWDLNGLEEVFLGDAGCSLPSRVVYEYLYNNPQSFAGLKFYKTSHKDIYLLKSGNEVLELVPQ